MGDSRRFDEFAKFIMRRFDPCIRIADVAGGKGALQTALRQRGYLSVTTYDKRRGRRHRPGRFEFHYRHFDAAVKESFDLLVGMHPDEATDHIIVEAGKRRVPFAICPCCVKPSAVPYWEKHSYDLWVAHLKRLALKNNFRISDHYLSISGRNYVLFGEPNEQRRICQKVGRIM